MDAIQLIKTDHIKVKNLFHEYINAPSAQPEHKRRLAEKIIQELMVHERVEEEIFYPAFKRTLGEKGQEEVDHAKEEHLLVDTLLAQLEELDLDAPDFEATMRVLKENVEHHIKDEEEKMLPMAQKWMSPQLLLLGKDMMEYKLNLEKQLLAQASKQTEGAQQRSNRGAQ